MLLLGAAAAWSVLVLLVGSLLLTPENGDGVVIVLSIPLLLVGLFVGALARRRSQHRLGPGALAWVLAGCASLMCLVGALTIGIFLVPVGALLLIVCGRAQGRGDVYA